MGIIERKQRQKDETRINILEAALDIVKAEGWHALSMRKIADLIEYTAPVIYEYFSSKEAILRELTRLGYIRLGQKLKIATEHQAPPAELMERMWLTYWDFAFDEKEYYQLMFGVDTECASRDKLPESEYPDLLFRSVIKLMYKDKHPDEQEVAAKYYTYWSVVHGLISINMVSKGASDLVNKHILVQSIATINDSIAL